MVSSTRVTSIGAATSAYAELPWGQLSLSSAAAFLVTAAMLNFAPLVPAVRAEFGISNVWAGLLTSATVLTHTVLQLPAGQVSDSLGSRRTIALGVAIIGLSVLASGFAGGVETLLLWRMLLGVGTAIAFVGGLTYASTLVAPQRRVLAQSVYGAAANLGTLAMLLISERLAAFGGWREALVIEGAATLAIGLLIAWRLQSNGAHAAGPALSWGATLRETPLWLLGLAHLVTYGAFTGVTSWVVTFLWERYGVGLEWAGPLAALLTLGAFLGRLFGGPFSLGRQRTVVVWSCFAAAVSLGWAPLAPSLPLSLLALFAFGWFFSLPFGAVFSYASLVSGRPASGREISFINGVANVGALSFPPLIGYALDSTGSYVAGFGMVAAIGMGVSLALGLWLPRARV
ncbi:MAG: MFS transporter [Chloroflexi bacterium]|nr:MFS transporter [Chloroflexota bacterium]MCL5108896.1 MFS transporter [Chloroflexota bacterium]